MTKFSANLAIFVAIATTALGCELIATVDRSKIGGSGGAGGATTSSTTSSTTTSTSGGGGTGGMNTGGMNTGGMNTGGMNTGGTGGKGTGGMGTGGMAPECTTPTDCAGQDTECQQRTCDKGVCGFSFTPDGTVLSAANQMVGDCQVVQCDGNGGLKNVPDDADVLDDGNPCTDDTCKNGTPLNLPSAAGSPCNVNGNTMCDGNGACVECLMGSDCTSNVCAQNKCVPASCADNTKNADETDVDCGGSCGPCDDGKSCALAADCKNGVCSGTPLTCQMASCTDGVKNGAESDVDCGGTCATKCGPGAGCTVDADCAGGSCSGTTCLPTCTDTVKNGSESDVDCGGTCSTKCAVGKACNSGGDCVQGVCGANNTCSAAACNDNVKNGSETDVDCGGSCAPALRCAPGLKCNVAGDCTSGVCTGGICQQPSCTDMVVNGGETDKDCGGPTCGACGIGLKCVAASDCVTNNCKNGICQAATCGDGVKNGTEACDDGNKVSGDGCSSTCTIESGFTCSGTAPSVCTPICGDGQKKGAEACDDGNTTSGDGCSSTCAVEAGFTCTGTPSVCTPVCGDGLVKGAEACDDGNKNNNDGCSATCTVETGFTCTGSPSACTATCGDGIKTPVEACDDGNTTSGDGCSAGCAVEIGYTCSGSPSTCTTICGDGLKKGAEACDDGNTANNDGCSSTCTVETGYTCTGSPSSCNTTCGDGIKAGSEACDDGNKNSNDGCSAACTVETGFTCTGSAPTVCSAICGDGIKTAVEPCDDGNTTNGDGCSSTCTVEPGFTCTGSPSTCVAGCGDGIKTGGEQCDDGNNVSGDGCSAACLVEPGYTCAGSPSTCSTSCGDGVKAGAEACDDGNNANGDGCSAGCTIESGYVCSGSPSTCATVCGDGIKTGAEACDDGNTTSGDGCTSTCDVEPGYTCTGSPSACSTTCGDGIKAGAEACDDGNTANGDGCSPGCAIEAGWLCNGSPSVCNGICGDGVKVGAETCDDANTVSGDGCSSTCKTEAGFTCTGSPSACTTTCGDGIKAGAEQCDDGNTKSLDGCSSKCKAETGYTCTGTAPSVCTSPVEINCNDGIDNDGNGLTDCADPACALHCNANVGACPAGDVALVYTSTDVPKAIPDGVSAGVNSVISVGLNGIVSRVVPQLNVTHTWDGDLTFKLISPGAVSTTLSSGIGSSGDNYTDTIFNSACATAISSGTPPYTGCFKPSGVFTSMIGAGSKGTWTLNASDSATPDAGTLNSWRLALCVTPTNCGDGALDAGETCDDGNGTSGDGCSSACAVESGFTCTGSPSTCTAICGDGQKKGTEQCDDGNTANGDGCSSTCQWEASTEVEPNNTCATANGPYTIATHATGTLINATMNPATEQDWFLFTVPVYADLWFETFDQTGPGSCSPTTVDTVIQLYKSDCTTTQSNSQDQGGIGNCSRLNPTTQPTAMQRVAPGTYALKVTNFGSTNTYNYMVQAKYVAYCGNGIKEGTEECDGGPTCNPDCTLVPVCGDTIKQAGEACDDGNTNNGDGCSSTCQVEAAQCGDSLKNGTDQCDDGNLVSGDGCSSTCTWDSLVAEVEPNDTTASADTNAMSNPLLLIDGNRNITGSIGVAGDVDIFKVSVATASVVRFELFDSSGVDCVGFATMKLTVLTSTGTTLKNEAFAGSGIGGCSALVTPLDPGTYYIKVERSTSGVQNNYFLQARFVTQTYSEAEINDTQGQANTFNGTVREFVIAGDHSVATDTDWFRFYVPPGASIRAEVVEGDNTETCESNGIDSTLYLHGPTGTQLGSDGDTGRGFCSLIDGTGTTPANSFAKNLAGGFYYLRLTSFSTSATNANQFKYRILVTIRNP